MKEGQREMAQTLLSDISFVDYLKNTQRSLEMRWQIIANLSHELNVSVKEQSVFFSGLRMFFAFYSQDVSKNS